MSDVAIDTKLVGMFPVCGGAHDGEQWYCDGAETSLSVAGITPAPIRERYVLRVLQDARGVPFRGWQCYGVEDDA